MNNIDIIKDQIIIEVRLALLKMRSLGDVYARAKFVALIEESLETQLHQLATEAFDEGFNQGQHNVMESNDG